MSWNGACPPPAELTRELACGVSGEMEEHLAECDECLSTWERFERLIEIGRELPEALPPAGRVEQVRSSILAAATTVSPRRDGRRWAWIGGAVAATIALAAIGWAVLGGPGGEAAPSPTVAVTRAVVHAHGDARYVLAGAQPDEIVRLERGKITVEVAALRPGERFRVVTGDGEVEVRGTLFDVTAVDDRLAAVNVISGRVEVRAPGGAHAVLAPGERWSRPTDAPQVPDPSAAAVATVEPERPTDPPVAEHRPARAADAVGAAEAPAAPAAAPAPSPAEAAFERGWKALRAGQAAPAAVAFEEAIAVGGGEPIVEDASFWRAVAHARGGNQRSAARALHAFLQRYPRSARAGEALTMLGWQLYDAGEIDAAEGHFRKALADPVAKVRDSARRGLEAVDAKRRNVD